MNKLFLILSGLSFVGATPIVSNFMQSGSDSGNLVAKSTNFQVTPIEATIPNVSVNKTERDIILRTAPIHLTRLGIRNNRELNRYSTIELPEFKINFWDGALITTDGYKWGAKMSEGEGNWKVIFNKDGVKIINGRPIGFLCRIEGKHSLWFDNNGYNLALVYRLNGFGRSTGGSSYPTPVSGQVGSTIKFY